LRLDIRDTFQRRRNRPTSTDMTISQEISSGSTRAPTISHAGAQPLAPPI
jgi:hypothetical protein